MIEIDKKDNLDDLVILEEARKNGEIGKLIGDKSLNDLQLIKKRAREVIVNIIVPKWHDMC